MSQTINRMYETPQRATDAAAALRGEHFDDVHVFDARGGAGEGAATLTADQITASMLKACVLKSHAKVFAEGIQRGGTLVTVHAPFGMADAAVVVLDRFGPVASGIAEPQEPLTPWDEAAPCSSAFGAPVLLEDSATFSRFWNVAPLLKSAATTSSALGLPESSGSSGPFAGTIPLPLLSRKATLLSSMLGLPVLSKRRAVSR